MSVRQESPPTRLRGPRNPALAELAGKANANRGEWFAVELPENIKSQSAISMVRAAVFAELGDDIDISLRQGVVYLRIAESL